MGLALAVRRCRDTLRHRECRWQNPQRRGRAGTTVARDAPCSTGPANHPVEAHTREHLEEDELRSDVAGSTFRSCLIEQLLESNEVSENAFRITVGMPVDLCDAVG